MKLVLSNWEKSFPFCA